MVATFAIMPTVVATAVFLAGSGAALLAAPFPLGTGKRILDRHASPLRLEYSGEESSMVEGAKTAPRARRKPDPTGAGMGMRTSPSHQVTDGDILRGRSGQSGDRGQTAMHMIRPMPLAFENSSNFRRLDAGTGTDTESLAEPSTVNEPVTAAVNAGVAMEQKPSEARGARHGHTPGGDQAATRIT